MEHSVLVTLIAEGLSTHKIAARLNTSQTNVRHWLEKYGLRTSPSPRVKKVVSWRQRTKQKAVEYKGGKCIRCGYSRCIRAMKFHHLDPTQKDFTIAGKSMSWERIRVELDKCILVCGNCHDEIHDSWQTGIPIKGLGDQGGFKTVSTS
jgi:formate hydrogenlyase subunit 6/NADH:ubiquinone oxidoreductase subunit I